MRLASRHQQDPGRRDFFGWNCHVADNLLADDSVGLRGGPMPCRLASPRHFAVALSVQHSNRVGR
jgi:hypothetical protein